MYLKNKLSPTTVLLFVLNRTSFIPPPPHTHIMHQQDIAFEIGRVLMGLEVFARAAELFRDSQRHFGVSSKILFEPKVIVYVST